MPKDTILRLVLDSASSDTVAVRFTFQPPRRWERVKLAQRKCLTLILEKGGLAAHSEGYYHLRAEEPLEVGINGPCQVQFRFRIDFDQRMSGTQSFVVRLEDNNGETLKEQTFRAGRDISASYKENPLIVPSVERRIRLKLGAGKHRLRVVLKGTMAKGGAVVVELLPRERYE